MTPERWEAVKRLFHDALERDPDQRAAYLAEAARDDPSLADEVRGLLSAQAQADDAFGGPTGAHKTRTLAAGTRLGPYEIVSLIGVGGMGEVYKARDTRLDRTVAVKVLPPRVAADADLQKRFEREARAISRLNHPHICALYDLGRQDDVSFLVMEYLEGETLADHLRKGPLALDAALRHAIEIAEALAEAHGQGIVHRDLKPGNVVLTRGGAKLLDFGIAKLREREVSGEARTDTLTHSGLIVGTPQYMAPEQLKGDPADPRTDIFLFGLVLYEMVSGRKAFEEKSQPGLIAAILERDPLPLSKVKPDAPPWLELLVRRCLEKDPARRWQSARDLLSALNRPAVDASGLNAPPEVAPTSGPAVARRLFSLKSAPFRIAVAVALVATGLALTGLWRRARTGGSGAPSGPRSIAVLPFQSFGGHAEDDYFLDGMTESIITDLAKTKDLLVIARNSVFQYKGKPVDVRKVGQELGVRYVLEGSVQRSTDRLRINAQLIDVSTGYHLWADRYDRDLKEVFAVQDDISRNIVAALRVALTPGEVRSSVSPPTQNLEAYDMYMRGLYLVRKSATASGSRTDSGRERAEVESAIPLLERAVALDPRFALGHAQLALAYRWMYFWVDPRKEWEEKASVEIQKALAVDPDLPDAYLARALLTWTHGNGFPHEAAIVDLRRALVGNPNLAEAHDWLGTIYQHIGLFDQALQEQTAAARLDPTTGYGGQGAIALTRLYQHQPGQVLAMFERNPKLGYVSLAKIPALMYVGREQEALRLAADLARADPKSAQSAGAHALMLARSGNHAEAEREIGRAIEVGKGLGHFHHTEYFIASAYAAMGKKRQALEWLEKTAADGLPCYPYFEKDPALDVLRGEPEFQAFMKKLKAQWEQYRKLV